MRLIALFLLSLLAGPVRGNDVPEGRVGTLQFLDGSILHGALGGIQETNGMEWLHPAAREPLQFTLTNLSTLRFEHAEAPIRETQPASRFQFQNGDELMGRILAIENNKLRFQSWFGEEVQADIASLDTIMFSSKGYKLLYEGPTGTNGWRMGRNPRSWEYRDGAFISNGADLLGRDFNLTGSSTLEFDLAWNGAFSLSITLYTDVIDRFDYSSSAYLVYLGTSTISVQRVQAGSGAVMLGQTRIPEMVGRNSMHFELRCNKDDATISLFADGEFIQRWRDNHPAGWVAKGGGIVFFSQVEPRSLKMSNIRVAEWDGRFEPDSMTNAPTDSDVVFLANRDRVIGDVLAVDGTATTVQTRQTKLEIPIERITQIRFAEGAVDTNASPTSVRASFPGGEKIVLDLEHWTTNELRGTSRLFGPLTLDPKHIREMQFNLGRTTAREKVEKKSDFEFLELE